MQRLTPAPKKWRPSLGMVVSSVCIALISIPFLALLSVRLTSNQFIRETEQSLIQQAAIYAQVYAIKFAALEGPAIGNPLSNESKDHWKTELHPQRPQLNVRADPILPTRPDGQPVDGPLGTRHVQIADELRRIARGSKKTTLAGVVFLDHQGRDLLSEGAPSFAALPEVKAALRGEVGAVMRARDPDFDRHRFSSFSRNTSFRVFLTFPVIAEDRVIGVVYLSRTPLGLRKFIFEERYALITMLSATLIGAGIVGLLLVRLLSRPIYALRDDSRAIAAGQNNAVKDVKQYGLRELAELSDSVSRMAQTLSDQSREVTNYTNHVTHELKSPVTAIAGAAELLQDEATSPRDRATLLANIQNETRRMNALLAQLRDMARLRSGRKGDPGLLRRMLPGIDKLEVISDGSDETILPLSEENGRVVLHHMAQNAVQHGASKLWITASARELNIRDNGHGISSKDLSRVAEPFFTTRRESGGTGMGLAIVNAILEGYGATLEALETSNGAEFRILFQEK
ncbi:MAG: GAF domain-containing sensor histidine kinase [Pseudomonadota bacterium]